MTTSFSVSEPSEASVAPAAVRSMVPGVTPAARSTVSPLTKFAAPSAATFSVPIQVIADSTASGLSVIVPVPPESSIVPPASVPLTPTLLNALWALVAAIVIVPSPRLIEPSSSSRPPSLVSVPGPPVMLTKLVRLATPLALISNSAPPASEIVPVFGPSVENTSNVAPTPRARLPLFTKSLPPGFCACVLAANVIRPALTNTPASNSSVPPSSVTVPSLTIELAAETLAKKLTPDACSTVAPLPRVNAPGGAPTPEPAPLSIWLEPPVPVLITTALSVSLVRSVRVAPTAVMSIVPGDPPPAVSTVRPFSKFRPIRVPTVSGPCHVMLESVALPPPNASVPLPILTVPFSTVPVTNMLAKPVPAATSTV